MSGNNVKIPYNVSRIVITCYGGASHEIAVLGGADLIVGQPPMTSFPELIRMYPRLNNTTNAGSFDNVNIEEILHLDPDIVIASVTSTAGNQKISDTGIPVITVLTGRANITSLMSEFKMMGQVLNNQGKSDALVSYWDNRLQMINDRLSKVPAEQRKSVYYLHGDYLTTDGGDQWGQYYISAAGGINVAQKLNGSGGITYEQLLQWDPDVIICSSNGAHFITVDDVKNNMQMSGLKAVKSGQIYECPIGAFWWDRPSPEAILGIEWLAKTLYPDQFSDINMVNETKAFYKEFYNYNLTDSEVNAFLNPKP